MLGLFYQIVLEFQQKRGHYNFIQSARYTPSSAATMLHTIPRPDHREKDLRTQRRLLKQKPTKITKQTPDVTLDSSPFLDKKLESELNSIIAISPHVRKNIQPLLKRHKQTKQLSLKQNPETPSNTQTITIFQTSYHKKWFFAPNLRERTASQHQRRRASEVFEQEEQFPPELDVRKIETPSYSARSKIKNSFNTLCEKKTVVPELEESLNKKYTPLDDAFRSVHKKITFRGEDSFSCTQNYSTLGSSPRKRFLIRRHLLNGQMSTKQNARHLIKSAMIHADNFSQTVRQPMARAIQIYQDKKIDSPQRSSIQLERAQQEPILETRNTNRQHPRYRTPRAEEGKRRGHIVVKIQKILGNKEPANENNNKLGPWNQIEQADIDFQQMM